MDAFALSLAAVTTAEAASVSLGDWPAWLMFGLATCGQCFTLWQVHRTGQRKAVEKGEKDAATEARQAAAMEALAKANDRVAKALESLDAWARGHELSDATWQASMAEVQKQHADAMTRLATSQENLQRQITNVALGLAAEDTAREVGASRPRRNRMAGN